MKKRTHKPKQTAIEAIIAEVFRQKGIFTEEEKEIALEKIYKEISDGEVKKTPKEEHTEEEIKKPSRDVIEQVRMLKARNIPQTQIAKSTDLTDEEVEQILESLPQTINNKSEMFSLFDAFNVMSLDLQYLITDTKEKMEKDEFEPFEYTNLSIHLNHLIKHRIDVLKAKSALLKSISQVEDKTTGNQKLISSEIKVVGIVNDNPPKISAEEIAEKSDLSVSRIRQLLNGENGNIGLIKKGYIQGKSENLEKGGARIYYSATIVD